ncbi:MAG: cytochrome c oxidase assembly protein [Gemmatimonadota bacterium]|nr:cytochrome c oxidase assembly protein [Gemmatimonadota bacterium]
MLSLAALHWGQKLDWIHWTIHPSTVLGIAALAVLYGWRARASRRAGGASPGIGQALAFAGGLLALFAALNGPIHDLSDSYLFSAHMVQHLMLTMLVTPLLLAGTPGWMLRPLLERPVIARIAGRLTTPVACFTIFSVVLTVWHLPPLYNFAMAHHSVHIVQHLCFLVASTFMWWPLMSPLPELPRAPYPQQMLYTFLLTLPMSLVSIAITYAGSVIYPAYASAPRISGLTPLEDQQLGGLIMWIPGGLIFLGVLTIVFFRWVAQAEEEEKAVLV